MPRMVAEIKNFGVGIVATPDSKDIPTDASDYSLNIEPVSSNGMIKGRKVDNYAKALGGFEGTSTGVSSVSKTIIQKLPTN